jgi:cytosine/adenosine deaminase-related metal-dependent hydrolase
LFGLHASFTLTDLTLDAASRIGHDLQTGFHIHVAEAEADQSYTREHFTMGVVERLLKHGILGRDTLAVHCVHVDEKEIDILAETGTSVIHNPQSNMNNGVGIADIVAMQQKGIKVGLGTDAMTVNMREELRAALWAQRLLHKNPSVAFMEVITTLFKNNASIASRIWGTPLGELREGAAADIAIVDYKPPTPLVDETLYGHLLFGIPHAPVVTTIVDGKVLMQDRKLKINIDEEQVAARSREMATKLWERF